MHCPLKHPKSELYAAARAIEAMNSAIDFETFELEWREFLSCLEKVWIKTERACHQQRTRFQPWQGRYQALRKKDALLRYLKQARDADNHSIQDLSQDNPGSLAVKLMGPNGDLIESIEIKEEEVGQYDIDKLFIVITTPHVAALPVKNHGEWFKPPKLHLNKPVEDDHPATLATLGFEFYSAFLANVEAEFFAG